MSNLPVIIRATRASARAVEACKRYARQHVNAHRAGDTAEMARVFRLWKRARNRFDAAQATLTANPLPGDTAP